MSDREQTRVRTVMQGAELQRNKDPDKIVTLGRGGNLASGCEGGGQVERWTGTRVHG